MHTYEGWVARNHVPNIFGTKDSHLHSPPINKDQVWGSFLEDGRLYQTRREALRAMRVALKMFSSVEEMTGDVRYVRLWVADDPDEWVEPFTKAHSYVVLWFYGGKLDRVYGTAVDDKGEDLPGVIRGYIPGENLNSNGNRAFRDFDTVAHSAYEASRQGAAYPKIAIWFMTMRPPRKRKVLSRAS